MIKKKSNPEQRLVRNLLIGFFVALFLLFVCALTALLQTLISFPITTVLPTVTIESCYDGDTCTSTNGEKIRLACIDTPELSGPKAAPTTAKAAREYLNNLVAGQEISIRRITKDRYGRTVAELSKGSINIQKRLVRNGYAKTYERYANQCKWSK